MIDRLRYKYASILGEIVRILCIMHIIKPIRGIENNSKMGKRIVVSLTSYGRRVSKTVNYTIISLLRQTYKPNEIVLWLDNDNWNENNLPKSLLQLKKYGLTIRFCEDIRSYKKLIPSLENYHNCLFITTDDDVYYKKDTIERLVNEYEKNPKRIYCHIAHGVKIDKERGLLSYREWEEDVNGKSGQFVFPVGIGCVLYDPELLFKDITRKELFTKLSPYADDVWFYFMEVLNGTECYQLPRKHLMPFYPVGALYRFFHKGTGLAKMNVGENMNDKQIQNIVKYYDIIVDRYNGCLVRK